MNSNILVITNNFNNSFTYIHAMMGYGYQVDDVQTFVGAKIRIRAGLVPSVVIIDMKSHADEQRDFIDFLTITHPAIQILIISNDTVTNIPTLHRPLELEDLLDHIRLLEIA